MSDISPDQALRSDIRRLGSQLGQSIIRQEGQPFFELVERVRTLSRSLRRDGDAEAGAALAETLAAADLIESMKLVRAFTTYFHLANVAEQVHRIEDLNLKKANAGRISDTVPRLLDMGFSGNDIVEGLQRSSLQPVFTAHPTEVVRRVLRSKHHAIAALLAERDRPDLTVDERIEIDAGLQRQVLSMWNTEGLRHRKPTPLDGGGGTQTR